MSYHKYSMQLQVLSLDRVRPPSFLLRPVRTDSVEFLEMLDSIRDNGLWQPILVRSVGDYFEIVEGNYRYTCCKQLRYTEIPAVVRVLSDSEVLVAQLQANGIRPETTPVEFGERLARLLHLNPDITISRLSILIRKSPTWIRKILSLRRLHADCQPLVKAGQIPLESAHTLSRLPHASQPAYLDLAATLPVREFKPLIHAEIKRLRENCQGRYIENHPVNQEKPVPYLRKVTDIKAEYRNPQVAGPVLIKTNAKTVMDGWKACLAWILHLDPDGLAAQEKMIVARRGQQQRAEERRRAERQQLRKLRQAEADFQPPNPRTDL